MSRVISALLIVVLLATYGCKVGPNYERPCSEIPEAFYNEPINAEDTLNLEWWRQFEDEVLVQLIEEALENNFDVKAAAGNIQAALGILIQNWAPLFPQIGYQGNYSRMRTSQTLGTFELPDNLPIPFSVSFPNPQTTIQALITASWQLDIWGRTRRLIEAAQANYNAAYSARQQVILNLVSAVADNYIKLRGLDEQLVISINTANSYADSVKYFQLQFNYGQSSQMALVQAQTQYEIAAANIPQVKGEIVQAENVINTLLSRNPQPIPRGKSIYDLKLPAVPADIPSELLHQRPDIMQAEQNLIATNAQIGAAIALYFPSITLTGFYGAASQELNNLFTGPSRTWNFVGAITGPIFTGGAIYGQVVQAEGETYAALNNYQQVIQEAFSEVETSLYVHSMFIEQMKALERLVVAAGEYQRLATLQYKGGYAPYFIVIQAQEQFFPAQLSLAQTRAQVFSSLVNIYQAMGGGWVNIAESKTVAGACEEVLRATDYPLLNDS